MKKETIIKFLNNHSTEAELEEVVRWAKEEAFSKESMEWGLRDWNLYQASEEGEDDEKFSLLFDKIQLQINAKGNELQQKGNRRALLPLLVSWSTRAAAILLIPVLILLFYTLSEKRAVSIRYANQRIDSLEIIAPIGSRSVLQLPDGSTVHLNYGSKIKYPQFFSGNTREILLEGEGYFDVVTDPDKPFIVKAGGLSVKALGTAFNVLAYPDRKIIETTLVSGKVVLEQNSTERMAKPIGVLLPGMHVAFNSETGSISKTQGNVEKYIGWKDGKLIFEDATIAQVADRLNRMFNVDIEIADDNDVKDFIYTVTFVNEPLFQILDLMTIATPIKYKALPRMKMPDGTFSKQKIIIEKR